MMAWLLDTHALLWFTDDPDRLSASARACVDAHPADIIISAASLWEIAIKRSLGKLELPVDAADLLAMARESGTPVLDISGEHAVRVEALPLHHRDPFDRLLVAQAPIEGLPIISIDTVFDRYGVERVW
jgi:PIN domain nuclease of toxin-antitoxin system